MCAVALSEAEKTLSLLIQKVLRGEEVLITDQQLVVAKLVPAGASSVGSPRFGSALGLFTIAGDFDQPLECFKEYRP